MLEWNKQTTVYQPATYDGLPACYFPTELDEHLPWEGFLWSDMAKDPRNLLAKLAYEWQNFTGQKENLPAKHKFVQNITHDCLNYLSILLLVANNIHVYKLTCY